MSGTDQRETFAWIRVSFGRDEYAVVCLEWNDSACYASLIVELKEGATRKEVLREAKKISGNGECSERGFAEHMTEDIMELCSDPKRRRVSNPFRVKDPEIQKEFRTRWEKRCIAFNMKAIGLQNVPRSDVLEILDALYVQNVTES